MKIKLLLFLLLFVIKAQAATVIYHHQFNSVIGIDGVQIDSQLYNVTFRYGSFDDAFYNTKPLHSDFEEIFTWSKASMLGNAIDSILNAEYSIPPILRNDGPIGSWVYSIPYVQTTTDVRRIEHSKVPWSNQYEEGALDWVPFTSNKQYAYVQAVPLPGALYLCASGLLMLVSIRKHKLN